MASLKEGFWVISETQGTSSSLISNVISFLTCNNEQRFWNVLEYYFLKNYCEKARELLNAFAHFYISEWFYPADFGARLLQLVRSLPPAARPKKIFPLFDEDLYIELSNLAKKSDYSDRLTLSDAV